MHYHSLEFIVTSIQVVWHKIDPLEDAQRLLTPNKLLLTKVANKFSSL